MYIYWVKTTSFLSLHEEYTTFTGMVSTKVHLVNGYNMEEEDMHVGRLSFVGRSCYVGDI